MTGGSAHQKRGSARTLCTLADAATPFAGGALGAESVESAASFDFTKYTLSRTPYESISRAQ